MNKFLNKNKKQNRLATEPAPSIGDLGSRLGSQVAGAPTLTNK